MLGVQAEFGRRGQPRGHDHRDEIERAADRLRTPAGHDVRADQRTRLLIEPSFGGVVLDGGARVFYVERVLHGVVPI